MTKVLETFSGVISMNMSMVRMDLSFLMAWVGGIIVVIFSFAFIRIIQLRIESWKNDRISPLPLEDFYPITSWVAALVGLTIMFTGVLQLFNFSALNSLIASLVLALITGIPMWGVVRQLLVEIESGTIKEIDQFF